MNQETIQTVVITNSNKDPVILANDMNLEGKILISYQSDSIKSPESGIENIVSNLKGISNNRNMALLNSKSTISVLADDDMFFYENYEQVVLEAFTKLPKASIIVFNIDNSGRFKNTRIKRVNRLNYMRYGASRLCFRTEDIKKKNIWFHSEFGAATYGSGEDTIFLRDCLAKGLRIYTYPISIAKLGNSRDSTWFTGYSRKYYVDKGALFAELSPFFSIFLIIRFAFINSKIESVPFSMRDIIKFMSIGKKEYQG